jgi:hypothetical protein
MATRKIDDGQPAKAESKRAIDKIALIIWAAMSDAPRHPLEVMAKNRSFTSEIVLSADSAHG